MRYKEHIRRNDILTYPPAFIVLKLSYVYYVFWYLLVLHQKNLQKLLLYKIFKYLCLRRL